MPASPLSLGSRLHSNWPTVIFTLALALHVRGAQAQTPVVSGLQIQSAPPPSASGRRITLDGPRPKGSSAVIYLDGQRRDSTGLARLNPDDIASINVLKNGTIARRLGPEEARLGVIFITTKTGQLTHRVRTFNRRLTKLQRAEIHAAPGSVTP